VRLPVVREPAERQVLEAGIDVTKLCFGRQVFAKNCLYVTDEIMYIFLKNTDKKLIHNFVDNYWLEGHEKAIYAYL
jgi:hypothetical protein